MGLIQLDFNWILIKRMKRCTIKVKPIKVKPIHQLSTPSHPQNLNTEHTIQGFF